MQRLLDYIKPDFVHIMQVRACDCTCDCDDEGWGRLFASVRALLCGRVRARAPERSGCLQYQLCPASSLHPTKRSATHSALSNPGQAGEIVKTGDMSLVDQLEAGGYATL